MKHLKKTFPDAPGIYLFKNSAHEIVYIGKAKSIYKRVHSYFQNKQKDWKSNTLIQNYDSIEYIVTSNEIEALLLEAQLIRDHQPKYNTLLKDGQPFLYMLFTGLNNIHMNTVDSEKYNNFPTFKLVRNKKEKGIYIGPFLHKLPTRRAFQFLIETFKLTLCNKKIAHGCLDYHLNNCAGTCRSDFDTSAYVLRLKLVYQILTYNKKQFITIIQQAIQKYSDQFAFEKAQHLLAYQDNIDLIFETLTTKFSERKFEHQLMRATMPSLLLENKEKLALELQALLQTPMPIRSIDCFDISHFQSSALVGSCVRFTDGIPDKNKFRRFTIKTLTCQNDYAALQEIVTRRYRSGDFPDLVLIDGGKGQLHAVAPLLPIACIALAKPTADKVESIDIRNENRIFYISSAQAVPLDIHTASGKLLIALRDYAHHFAITYHRQKQHKNLRF